MAATERILRENNSGSIVCNDNEKEKFAEQESLIVRINIPSWILGFNSDRVIARKRQELAAHSDVLSGFFAPYPNTAAKTRWIANDVRIQGTYDVVAVVTR